MSYDVDTIRQDFPALFQKIHGKDLIYFDNGATTLKPKVVIDAIVDFYSTVNSNIHRGIHYLSQQSTDRYEFARNKVAQFINALHAHEVIFTSGATDGINLVAFSFGETFLKEGDEIIISAMEHHSNLVPWQMLCERKKGILKFIPFNDDGVLDIEAYKNLLTDRTRLVAVTYVSNSLGTVNPVKEIIEIAHAANAVVLIDGAQAVQHFPIDVQTLDCDFFVFSGHKIYGPTGIGVLWGKESLLDKMVPYKGGGDMIETVTLEKTTYNTLPFKFEAGTSNYVDAYALAIALDYVSSIGISKIARHEQTLMEYATQKLREIDHLIIYGNAPQKSGVISFLFKGVHPADIGMILDKQGIAVRTGTHCTEPVMQFYNIPGTVRASFGMYNTIAEIDVLLSMLKKISTMFYSNL